MRRVVLGFGSRPRHRAIKSLAAACRRQELAFCRRPAWRSGGFRTQCSRGQRA